MVTSKLNKAPLQVMNLVHFINTEGHSMQQIFKS